MTTGMWKNQVGLDMEDTKIIMEHCEELLYR